MSRLLAIRIPARAGLLEHVEAVAREHGIRNGIVRGGPGSLMSGCLETGAGLVEVPGPGAEILTMVGDLHDGRVALHGAVGDPDGRVYAGRFVPGRNQVCITVELVIEERDTVP